MRSLIFTESGFLRGWVIGVCILGASAAVAGAVGWYSHAERAASIRNTGYAYHPDVFDDADAGVRCYYVDHGANGALACVKVR